MSNCLLSIVVPTADRTELLYETLKNIRAEVERSGMNIPILVIDNASNPPVKKNRCNELDVELRRFESRGDVGDSIIRAVAQADSEYVWVFGDDDLMCQGVIFSLFPLLQGGCNDIVYMNRYIAPVGMDKIEGTEHPVEVVDKVHMSGAEGAKRFTHHPGFISALVFRRTLMKEPEHCERLFPGYGFMAEIYRNGVNGGFVYLTKPQVIQRRSQALWKANWPKFWLVTLPEMFKWLEYEHGVSGALTEMRQETKRIELRTLLAAKASGYKRSDLFWMNSYEFLSPFGKGVSFVLQNLIPKLIARLLYHSMFRFKGFISGLKR